MRDRRRNGSTSLAVDLERGAVLLLALILTTTFALMALGLLASSDFAARGRLGGAAQEQAERAAASGIEWAAAKLLAGSLTNGNTSWTSADGTKVGVLVDRTASPQVVARARCRGAEVALGADLRTEPGAPLPYALAVFDESLAMTKDFHVTGSAYLAGSPTFGGGAHKLRLTGDLFVTASSIASNRLVQTGGTTTLSMPALALPVVDLSPFATMASGAVTVTRYSGTTTLKNLTLNGIVIVDLVTGETLELDDTTINGTLVVRNFAIGKRGQTNWLITTSLLAARVNLKDKSRVLGGTAWTGNLAVLAPFCDLYADSSTGSLLRGVVVVSDGQDLKDTDFEGQLVVLDLLECKQDGLTVTRPSNFTPNTPLGITWPLVKCVRIDWRGRR